MQEAGGAVRTSVTLMVQDIGNTVTVLVHGSLENLRFSEHQGFSAESLLTADPRLCQRNAITVLDRMAAVWAKLDSTD